jgi:hypothetical protein
MKARDYTFLATTESLCPQCLAVVPREDHRSRTSGLLSQDVPDSRSTRGLCLFGRESTTIASSTPCPLVCLRALAANRNMAARWIAGYARSMSNTRASASWS